MTRQSPPAPEIRRTIVRAVASLFFSFHALAIIACIIPSNSALFEVVYPSFKPYLNLTGNWQGWNMFHTIPYDHDYEVVVRAIDSQDDWTELGFVLPGLSKDKSHVRIFKVYAAFQDPSFEIYRDPYLQNLGSAVSIAVPESQQYEVRMVSHQMLGLDEVRQSGIISRPIERQYGPFPIR